MGRMPKRNLYIRRGPEGQEHTWRLTTSRTWFSKKKADPCFFTCRYDPDDNELLPPRKGWKLVKGVRGGQPPEIAYEEPKEAKADAEDGIPVRNIYRANCKGKHGLKAFAVGENGPAIVRCKICETDRERGDMMHGCSTGECEYSICTECMVNELGKNFHVEGGGVL